VEGNEHQASRRTGRVLEVGDDGRPIGWMADDPTNDRGNRQPWNDHGCLAGPIRGRRRARPTPGGVRWATRFFRGKSTRTIKPSLTCETCPAEGGRLGEGPELEVEGEAGVEIKQAHGFQFDVNVSGKKICDGHRCGRICSEAWGNRGEVPSSSVSPQAAY
jgi:hypothetical protein